ncbi:hypothetical protein ACLBVB_35665, partial [Pseudomonas aeruginosa]|uniref:hypothetical protein n=1 Tax=Pseudomonas aeruginosa TaxID=287 RepID=UPI0039694137
LGVIGDNLAKQMGTVGENTTTAGRTRRSTNSTRIRTETNGRNTSLFRPYSTRLVIFKSCSQSLTTL